MRLIEAEKALVRAELAADLGRGDLFERALDAAATERPIAAALRAKQPGVFAAKPYVAYVCELCGVEVSWQIEDGERFEAGAVLAIFRGSKAAVLQAERAALNFAQHASGIATKTAAMRALMGNSRAALLDTRKTRPGLRIFEKYAIRCGGGRNHRMGLDDVVMLKDTHFAGAADWAQVVAAVRAQMPFYARIEIECDTFEEFERALAAGADAVLLDAFSPQDCARAVAARDAAARAAVLGSAGAAGAAGGTVGPRYVLLEASGNIDESTIAAYAASGVDAISSGANIHQATWIDMSLRPLAE